MYVLVYPFTQYLFIAHDIERVKKCRSDKSVYEGNQHTSLRRMPIGYHLTICNNLTCVGNKSE